LNQAWYAELLLEINLKILLRKTGARLNFKIALIFLHIDLGLNHINKNVEKKNLFVSMGLFINNAMVHIV
jgi:hypothetical protein